MKIYIAGKITGLKDYKEHFNKAEDRLNKIGHKCMNPSILPEGFPWEIYMPICYAMIDACDCIYLLENWIDSKGAHLELEYARKNHKEILYEHKEKALKEIGCIGFVGHGRKNYMTEILEKYSKK